MGLLSGLSSFFFGDDAQKYDPNSAQAQAARTMGGPNHQFDVNASSATGRQSQGTQLDTANYGQDRGRQGQLAGLLSQQAQGQGPSAAAMAGAAQRDANLAQAAALQGGRRGQSAGVGIRTAGNQAVAGNQQAAQTQAIGQANEMNQARAQLGGVLGNMANQDIGVAGQNAQLGQSNSQFNANLGQQNSQFNANLGQNAALANQNTQFNEANAELQQRARQEGLSYSNLQPGQPGFFSPNNVGTFLGAAVSDPDAKEDRHRLHGGMLGRALSPVDAKYDIAPVSNSSAPNLSTTQQAVSSTPSPAAVNTPQVSSQQQSAGGLGGDGSQYNAGSGEIGPNTREKPNWYVNSASAYGNVIGNVLSKAALAKRQELDSAEGNIVNGATGGGGGENGSGAGGGMLSSILPIAAAAMSDERSKSDVHRLDEPVRPSSRDDAREMFEEAPPYSYFYKPDAVQAGAPPGRQVSVMWDDLQKTKAGRQMDGGREQQTGYHMVDYMRGLPTAFASLSDLNQRMDRLERSKGAR